jgi:hypothetical protein
MSYHEQLYRPLLPRLVNAIGMAATVRLLEARGGTILQLGAGKAPEVLPELIGEDAAAAFMAAFAGYDRVTLPMPDKLLAKMRNEEIAASRELLPTIARRYNLTVRQVLNIRREARETEPSPQQALL